MMVQDKTEEPSVKSAAAFRNAGFYEIKDFWIRPSHLCLVCGMRTISKAVEHLFCVWIECVGCPDFEIKKAWNDI